GSALDPELSPVRLLNEQLDPKGGMGRVYYLGYLYDLFHREGIASFWMGLGPSRFSSSSGAFLGARLLGEATRGAHAQVIPSQLIATLSEYGLLGLAAFGWLVLRALRVMRAAARRAGTPGWRGFAEGAVGAGL